MINNSISSCTQGGVKPIKSTLVPFDDRSGLISSMIDWGFKKIRLPLPLRRVRYDRRVFFDGFANGTLFYLKPPNVLMRATIIRFWHVNERDYLGTVSNLKPEQLR